MATPSLPVSPAAMPTTILLIGSTGNGKSTLGNFLLHPEEMEPENLPFKTATDNKPETQVVQAASDKVDDPTLHVIDTPGLNSSGVEDIRHMIDVVRSLKKVGRVTACVLCIKFEAKIDTQYRETIGYYRQLLPSLFEGNILIVLTNFATDKRSVALRKRQGINVDKVVKNTVDEVMSGGFVSFEPQVFLIDSLPFDMDPGDDSNQEYSEDNRAAILDYIKATMIPIEVDTLKVPKTPALKQKDDNEIETLDAMIHLYNSELTMVHEEAKTALDKIEEKEQEKSQVDCKLHRMKEERDNMNTTDLVIASKWSVENEWKLFEPWQVKTFNCLSPLPLRAMSKWDNGNLNWVDIDVKDHSVKGAVKGHFFRGLYANVTIKTYKKDKYREEIQQLCMKISEQEKELKDLEIFLSTYRGQQRIYGDLIDVLQGYIGSKKEARTKLLPLYMTLEEAEKRLTDLLST